jgi:hypothetical protein
MLGAARRSADATRLTAVGFLIPVLVWDAVRTRWSPIEAVVVLAFWASCVTPHLLANRQASETGDALYSITVHTRFFYNRDNIGQPGLPTAEEYRDDPYVGEPLSSLEYIFGKHSLPEAAGHFIRGFWYLGVWKGPRYYLFYSLEWLMIPGLIGAWALIRRRQWWVAVWFVLATGSAAFLASKGASWRIGAELQILAAWVWALGVYEVGSWCYERIRKKVGPKLSEAENESATEQALDLADEPRSS